MRSKILPSVHVGLLIARRAIVDALVDARHWNAETFDLWNLNKLLNAYPGADGVKPGFTDNAGKCLVGSAVKDNHRVFVTVMHSEDTTNDTKALLDYAFASFRWAS